MKVIELVKQHRKGISVITALILIENIAWIMEPTLFGNLIDAFIEKASSKNLSIQFHHIAPLIIWIGTYLVNSISGTFRRMLEPKVFQKMYVSIVTKIAEMGKKYNDPTSRTAARAQLSQEYVTFMQYRVPEIVEQSIAIVGAVIALTFFDFRISIVCLFISLPLIILSNIYSKHVVKLQSELHDNFESVYDVISSNDTSKVQTTYERNARLQEKIAKWGSINFGIMRLVLLFIFLFVLYIAIDLDDFSTGDIYSIVAYLWTFVTSVEYIPELLESKSSLSDLSNRLRADE